ncbi:MAG TPA: sugar ABC transporter permease [Bacillales bacterium]
MTDARVDEVKTSSKAQKRSFIQVLGNTPIPWILPLALILICIFLYPIIEIVRLSFTNASLVGDDYSYTLSSYTSLFTSPGFIKMLWVTGFFVGFSVLFQMAFGFVIALMIDQGTKRNLVGTVVTRTAVLSAWAIPGVIIGIIWSLLYSETESGILNYFLSLAGVTNPVAFLSDPINALISVTVANVWRGTAFSMIFVYAGLQTFPNDVIEAAKIDGAGAFQRLFKVIIPILKPIILVNLIVITVETFNTFDMVMALTGGGPGRSTEVIALSIYNQIFNNFHLGEGAAAAVLLLVINIALTVVYFRFLEKGSKEGRA